MSNRGRGRGAAPDTRGRGRGDSHRGGPPSRGGFQGGGRGGPPAIFQANVPAQIRLKPSDSDQLVTAFKKLAVTNEMPLRPGYGKLGREVTLRANFFAIKVPKTPIFDYSVDITPKADVKSQSMKSRVFQLLEQSPQMAPHRSYIAHDKGARLVSARELPQPLDVQVQYHDEGEPLRPEARTLNVEITFVRKLDTTDLNKYLEGGTDFKDHDPLPLISALNMVLQQHASTVSVRFGKNRYFLPQPGPKPALSPALDAWRGYYSSIRPAHKQLLVNVNVCMTAFYHGGSLVDALEVFRQRSGGMPSSFSNLKLKIVTNHLGYPMKKQLKKIVGNPANTFFDCAEYEGRTSVATYFLKKYNRRLNPNLPVVDVGGPNKATFLPAELCNIAVNQPYAGKLTDLETAAMIKVACNPPAMNADFIVNEGLGQLGLRAPASATMNGFGITVDTEMTVVPGRVLPAPRLSYLGGGTTTANNGSWNILNVKFQRPGVLGQWVVIIVQDFQRKPFRGPDDPDLLQLTNGFWNKLKSSGIDAKLAPIIRPTPPLPGPSGDPGRQKALDIIEQTMKAAVPPGKKPNLFLFLLSGRDDFIYPGIKKLCDMKLGVASVCMQLQKARGDPGKQDQYFSNVALKVNTKLGGVNHLVDEAAMKWLKEKPTMMVGMDVTHPGPTSIPGTPSVAAVVASTDNTFSQFPASMRLQQTKVEMIQDLTAMMLERLHAYKAKSKGFPERVYVYRDGVSEGQFDLVLGIELPQILEAFKKLNVQGKPYRPKLTIMICGKRHHARFYPTKEADAAKNGNTMPGTVVDRGVTSVYNFDFYLQAHAGLQGQVRPTHYTVVYDENRLDADTVQQGTHVASYLYVRATKAVSLVPAAYYADLACERARCYINRLFISDAASSAGGRRDKDTEQKRVFEEAEKLWGKGIHDDLKGTMFYI